MNATFLDDSALRRPWRALAIGAAVLASAVTVLVAAPLASAQTQTFSDPAGDVASGTPDMTDISVTTSADGTTYLVSANVGGATYASDFFLYLYLDTTGDNVAEYLVRLLGNDNRIEISRWNGSGWDAFTASTLEGTSSLTPETIKLGRADIGGAQSFHFWLQAWKFVKGSQPACCFDYAGVFAYAVSSSAGAGSSQTGSSGSTGGAAGTGGSSTGSASGSTGGTSGTGSSGGAAAGGTSAATAPQPPPPPPFEAPKGAPAGGTGGSSTATGAGRGSGSTASSGTGSSASSGSTGTSGSTAGTGTSASSGSSAAHTGDAATRTATGEGAVTRRVAATAPRAVRAGRPFTVGVRVLPAPQGNALVVCRATISGRTVGLASAELAGGRAACTLRLAAAARGKVARVAVQVFAGDAIVRTSLVRHVG